ncbi:MAG TPA: hypothetical protein VI322_05035 [Candidatus Saccharimonadia bacterium]
MLVLADVTVSLKSVMDVFTPIATLVVTILLGLVGLIVYFLKRLINQVDALAQEIKPIRPAIVELQGLLAPAKLKKLLFPLTVAPGSPLKVTPFGEKLLVESGFKDIIDANADRLVESVKSRGPKTNYDIQEAAFATIRELIEKSDPLLTPIKSYAFNNGLELDLMVPPAAVTLRDEVMKTLKFDD